jgi:cohesin complex subunit SA-1/2
MPDDYVSDEDVPTDEDEPAEEEVRERNRKASQPKTTKPAAKKPKTNGTTLPMRPATGGAKKKRPAKKTKAVDAGDTDGLYGEVFTGDNTLEFIAAEWLKSFDMHESQALADVVNFTLKCAGCNTAVSDHNIEDPDGATNRLTDIQEEYQATEPTEFPLHRKGKAGVAFKETVSGFLIVLVKSIAANGLLFNNPMLIENIEVWFSSMSSAASRAFRHTATVASLSVMTALCEVAADRANEASAAQRQADSERRKTKVNQARVRQLDQKVREMQQWQEFVEMQIKDWFDTVFIHRYRDIDPVIRKDCAAALGDWVMTLPHMFFDGHYLRYLGWVLSDSAAPTRAEVIKQLHRLYKEENKIGGLRTFTERFRGRLVEIATSDAESTVRASGVDLLDVLRENGLLEPDDIDAVGRLLYDSDVRVRKAVSKFFAENVNDLYNSKIDELGGLESLEESLPDVGEGSFETPKLEWLKFKSLAEMLVNYDADDDLPSQVERSRGDGGLILHAAATESRFTLAADALFDKIEEMKDWEALSGYLLFDHSSRRSNGVANDALSQLKHEAILTEKEAFVLLEVVSSSVKRTLQELHDKSISTKTKLSKKQKEQLTEDQEDAARQLATLIPKLLKKFGDVPDTAAAVLRMESVLDMPSLGNLHGDSVTYSAILDDVRKQFMSHGTDEVLAPASKAIQHARSYMELEEVTEERVGAMWEDVINNLTELIDVDTITVRGATATDGLRGLSNNLLRIIRLSEVSNPITSLEDNSVATSNESTGVEYQGAIDYIIALVQRAEPATGPALDPADASLEDEIAARAAEAALRYLQWKLSEIIKTVSTGADTEIPYAELEALATRRDNYVHTLHSVLESRKAGESVCVTMANYILELHTVAVVLKNIPRKPGASDDWEVLIMDLDEPYLKSIMKVFSAVEKNFARLSGRKLDAKDDEDIDADPINEDPLSDSDSEDDEDEATQTQASQLRRETKQRNTVIAERTLCEMARGLIYAVHAGVVDVDATKKRLERNKLRLGPNYKEICAYLDLEGAKGKGKSRSKAKAKPKGGAAVNGVGAKKNPKSNAIVAEDEEEDEIEDEVEEEDEGQVIRMRELIDRERREDEEDAGAEAESVLGD